MERWGVDRVLALAPDSASQTAGRKLATPKPWSDTGWSGNLLWGSCQGSGRTPYQVAIDLSGPRYKCSCPSRKFPCKHSLGLLFLWAEGQLDTNGGISEFATEWAAKHEQRVQAEAEPKELTAEQVAQAEARAAQREERVAAGLAELNLWLTDQLTGGLVANAAGGYPAAERMAARMVDAQAGGIATRLRTLPLSRANDGFAATLSELALIRLLITANAAELDPDLQATVRGRIGQPTAKAVALANPGVRDIWVVTGMKDSAVEQVSARRVWLVGQQTGRQALVLSFSAGGSGVDNSLLPGMVVDADLHFYPGTPQLRAALGTVHAEQGLGEWVPTGGTIEAAIASWRQALAADPWLTEWPVAIWGTLHAQPAPAIRDGDGVTMPALGPRNDLVQFLAVAGPAPTVWFGELTADGFAPTSALVGDQVVAG